MARLWSNGFELQSTTSGMEWDTTTGSPSISTTNVHSGGAASLRCNPTAATAFIYHAFRVDAQTKTFIRFYLRVDTRPASDTVILKLEDSTPASVMSLRLSSAGTLKVWADPSNVQVGSSSSALAIGQWYRIEFAYDDADANNLVSARIDGVDFVTNATGDDIAGWGRIGLGIVSSATADIYIDDVAINDTSGSDQNSYPGAGSIIHLHPNAAGDNSGGTVTGAATRQAALDEITPNDSTDYVTLTSTGDIIDVGVEDLTNAASVTLVQVGHRASMASAAAGSVALRIKSASGGTVTSSSQVVRNTTAWSTHDDTVNLHQYKLTAYTDPTTGTAWTVTGTNSIANMQIGLSSTDVTPNPSVTALWALVEYIYSADVDTTLNADYVVDAATIATVSAAYAVAVNTTVTKTAAYVVTGFLNITKSAQYTTLATGEIDIASGYEVRGTPLQKRFMYKVYSPTGTYLNTWSEQDIVSDFGLKEAINSSGSEVTLKLARPADDFGEGDDVAYRNKVQVYVIDKENPNGILRFTGFISAFESNYNEETVNITVLGYGADLNKHIMEDGSGNTTIAYNSMDPSNILKAILDDFTADGGVIDYDGSSIALTGTTVSYTFNTNTVKEGIDKCLELAPENWYYYIDQATNILHFKELATSPDHIFSIGRDIKLLSLKKSLEPVINTVYFSGGDTGGGSYLYKKYTIPASITAYGIRGYRYKDGRVTLTATAALIANKVLRGDPDVLVTVSIVDSNLNALGYDLESIMIGQTVKIGSSGIGPSSAYDTATFDTSPFDYDLGNLSSIVFQITELDYTGDVIGFSLSTTPPDITKRIEDISRNLVDIQTNTNPTAPS